MLYDCFISYSRKDAALVDALTGMLTEQGIDFWIDRKDSVAGCDYAASIVRSIKESKLFVLIVSKPSEASRHVLSELNAAVSADKTVIPVKIDDCPLSDAFEYYLGKTQWIDARGSSDDWYPRLLCALRNALNEKDEPTRRPRPAPAVPSAAPAPKRDKRVCRMLRYQDLLDLGYTSKKIAIKLVENDYVSYNGIVEENEGTPEQWEAYLRDESDTFRYLVNGNDEIVGDWSIVALNEESRKKVKAGRLLERDLDISSTVKICLPGVYHGYILTCSPLPEYRTQKNYLLLLRSFFEQIRDYAENGVFFDEWTMNVFSTDVESLMLSLGFTHIADNEKTGRIYYRRFIPFPDHPYIRSFARLAELYENKK